MSERNWTKPQLSAITAWGGSLLISAAAGSGKTAVLVERAIRLLCHGENPIPADRLLVVTFSNAAALEMKQRMSARLSALIRQQPENLHLQRQQALLAGAQISTIHSFCLELIRQNFQYLDISPDFAMADQGELAILKNDCARECIEEFYIEDNNVVFTQLVELLSAGRDDSRLLETILKIHEFARSHPFYLHWLDAKEAMYSPEGPVSQTIWGQTILTYVVDSLVYCRATMEEALAITQEEPALEKGYRSAFLSDLQQIEACLATAQAGGWDDTVKLLGGYTPARLGVVKGADFAKERAKALREKSKKILTDLAQKTMSATEGEFAEDLAELAPKISVLFSLVKAFDTRFRQAKAEKKRLDFSDLEHLALELLVNRQGDSFCRSQLAQDIAARYEVVMVDEYQDTNEVQDMIFTSVSNNQENLFMVGDVKQSIYSFRQAMPEIFLGKKQRFYSYREDNPTFPAKIILDTNFRSRSQVTQGVNFLFQQLMSSEMGEVDYSGDELLTCGAVYPHCDRMMPEFLLLDASELKDKADIIQLEAESVAKRIAQMVESGFLVSQGEEMRPCTPADFCILLRSPRERAETYVKALAARGVPAVAEKTGGYLEAREVSAVVSLLQALDNPLLDVELAGAMLSPLFAFSDDEIASIRLAARGKPFFTALTGAAKSGDAKAEAFLALFHKLRQAAALLAADKLLLKIYDLTDALAVVGAMPLGESRVSNLLLLVEYAAQYHALGYKGLSGFVGFLDRLKERGGDLAPAAGPGQGGANGVRILSIHRSKGLEFPVVFLCDTFRQFNKKDLWANTLLHSRLGFACVRREEHTRKQFATVPMQAIRLEMERSLLSEELRVLYVALTRAREKLIITGCSKQSPAKKLAGLASSLIEGRLSPYSVRDAACSADWMLMALLHHPSGTPLRELAGVPLSQSLPDENPWEIGVAQATIAETQGVDQTYTPTAQPDEQLLECIRQRTNFVYPYSQQTTIPTKLGVSSVAKGQTDPAYRFAARPKFLTRTALTPAEKGNALHKFMQFADYDAAQTDLEAEITRMKEQRFLIPLEADSLSRRQLRKFFDGKLAQRIFSAHKVVRELKFTAECGKEIVGEFIQGLGEEDKIVLQGVADCVFFELDGAVVVDYKTDVVDNVETLVQRYRGQLALYRRILEKSLETPIKQCIVYSFALGKYVEV